MSPELVAQLKRHEGFRSKPYKDSVGKITIGYGWNLDDVGITQDEAEKKLASQIHDAELELARQGWFGVPDAEAIRREVLTNMTFNLGMPRLLGFRRMIAALHVLDYEEAAKEMLDSRWAIQVGSRSSELADQMRTGERQS